MLKEDGATLANAIAGAPDTSWQSRQWQMPASHGSSCSW
jgi:hypothetical protein